MKLDSILVALDSSGSMPLLRAAAELANQANAELRAIYIEDTQWFEASKFSFTQQVSSFKGELTPFDENQIKRQSQALSSILRKRFSDLGNSMKIRYSYHSIKGSIDQELMKAAGEVDLVMIGKTGHTFEQRKRLGSNARYLAEQCSVPVLIWNSGSKWPNQMIGICRQTEESESTIQWAIILADRLNRDVRLFWPESVELNEEALNNIDDVTGSWPDAASRILYVSERHPVLDLEILSNYRNALFIVQRKGLPFPVVELLERLKNSVLLID